MTTSPVARVAGLVIGQSAPMEQAKEAATSALNSLADVTHMFHVITTYGDNMNSYVSKVGEGLQHFKKAVRTFARRRKKIVEEYEEAKRTYAARKEELLRHFIDAKLTFTSAHLEAARNFSDGTAGVRL